MKSDYETHSWSAAIAEAIEIVILLFITAAWLVLSCTPDTPGQTPGMGNFSHSVVTLVRPVVVLTDDDMSEVFTYKPVCSAFAVRCSPGACLLTAAHCVEAEAHAEGGPGGLGAYVRFEAPDGWGYRLAKVALYDRTADTAMLTLDSEAAEGIVPLEMAQPPPKGGFVTLISALYRARSAGAVLTELGEGRYLVSASIVLGWSGSPALDAQGRVWGLVQACNYEPELHREGQAGGRCLPAHTIVGRLP